MRLSTTFLALSLSLSTVVSNAYSIQEDNSLFARYDYEPSDLYIRGGVISKLSGGEKSKKGKAPAYKHAHRDPPPRYEPSHHHPPPFDGEWDPNQADYTHNHKSPATGGGRHGGSSHHRRDYMDIEDYLMRRGGMMSKLSGGEKSKKGKAPDYKHAHRDPPPRYEPSHHHPPPFDGEWDPNQSDYSHNHKSPATGGGRHGGSSHHRREYMDIEDYLMRRGGMMSKLSGGEKSKKGKAPDYKHAHRDPPPRYEPSHHHPPPFDGEWDPNQSDYSHNHKSPAHGGGRHGGSSSRH